MFFSSLHVKQTMNPFDCLHQGIHTHNKGISVWSRQSLLSSCFQSFSATTSLYSRSQTSNTETDWPSSPWTGSADLQPQLLLNFPSEPFPGDSTRILFGTGSDFDSQTGSDFSLDLGRPVESPIVPLQRSWSSSDPWNDQSPNGDEVMFSGWRGRAGAAGRVVERASGEVMQRITAFSDSPFSPPAAIADLSPPAEVTLWGRGRGSKGRISANHDSRCWTGGERRRGGGEVQSLLSIFLSEETM